MFISRKQLLLIVGIFFIIFSIKAQTDEQKQKIIAETNVKVLQIMQQKASIRFHREKARALELARKKGWPVRIEKDGRIMELQRLTDDGQPIYYTTYNVDAARSTRANTLHNGRVIWI